MKHIKVFLLVIILLFLLNGCSQPKAEVLPTYTPYPTLALLPTYTLYPTLVPLPTYTLYPTMVDANGCTDRNSASGHRHA